MGSVQHDDRAAGEATRPQVPEGERVYAIGDIHGRDDLLVRLHRLIAEDAAAAGPARNTLVYLGDYVDRGPASRQVLERLAAGPPAGFDAVHLKGNHDDFLLRFLEDGSRAGPWLANGGVATLASYGVAAVPPEGDARIIESMRRELAQAFQPSHLAFLHGLAAWHAVGDYLFVHAGVRPGIDLGVQNPEDMMWIRREFLEYDRPFGAVVVHGHSISPVPDFRANRIGIDTGAYYSGHLTCLVLEGRSRRILQT